MWAGTFGEGLFARGPGGTWRNVRKSGRGLGSDYIGALAADSSGLWVGSIAHGYGRMDRDGHWVWWGREQLGNEYLFPTDIALQGDRAYVATTDGLRVGDARGARWLEAGLRAEYQLAVAAIPGKDAAWVGHLHGLSRLEGTKEAYWRGGKAPRPIRDLLVVGQRLIMATDEGVGVSSDDGRSWALVGDGNGLPSRHATALAERDGKVWVGTASGLVLLDPAGPSAVAKYRNGPIPRRNQVNALLASPDGVLHVGTSEGLWKVEPGAAPAEDGSATPCVVDSHPRPTPVPRFPRPVAEEHNDGIDWTYQYGGTWDGQFQMHHGVELNNPEGVPLLAVGPGTVTFAGEAAHATKAVVVRQDQRFEEHTVYSVYLHLARIDVKVGQAVRAGDRLGTCGHTGRATNDHLHFEVRLTPEPGDGVGQPAYNPLAFLAPRAGTGAVAGVVRRPDESRIPGTRVFGLVVPFPRESPFSWAETYALEAEPNPALDENFYVADVPPGIYPVSVEVDGKVAERCVEVRAGQMSWVELVL